MPAFYSTTIAPCCSAGHAPPPLLACGHRALCLSRRRERPTQRVAVPRCHLPSWGHSVTGRGGGLQHLSKPKSCKKTWIGVHRRGTGFLLRSFFWTFQAIYDFGTVLTCDQRAVGRVCRITFSSSSSSLGLREQGVRDPDGIVALEAIMTSLFYETPHTHTHDSSRVTNSVTTSHKSLTTTTSHSSRVTTHDDSESSPPSFWSVSYFFEAFSCFLFVSSLQSCFEV